MKFTKEKFHVPHLEELRGLLDEVVRLQAGTVIADAIDRIRQLAFERRAGMPNAETRLIAELEKLDAKSAIHVIRALTMYFDLANLAEDLNRIRTLQTRSRISEAENTQRQQSLFSAVEILNKNGLSASEMQELIAQLRIEFVFTAHPSEAKRRTSRRMLRRLRQTLIEMTQPDVAQDVRPRLQQKIRADITAMWQSDLLRPTPPDVMSEVKRGLFFSQNLWKVVPDISHDLRESLAFHYPNINFEFPPPVRFGTWIGGDRDGHPLVTIETTAHALAALRATALECHLRQCHELMDIVVTSERHVDGLDPLREAVTSTIARMPALGEKIAVVSETEIGRRWLKIIESRLQATHLANADLCYTNATEFEANVTLLANVLSENAGADIVESYVQPWLDNIRCFGFHFAAMDIRQHSGVHKQVLEELFREQGICGDYASTDEATRQQILIDTFDQPLWNSEAVSNEGTAETMKLFQLMAEQVQQHGLEVFGGYIISMTHEISDVLAVLWLWNQAWLQTGSSEKAPHFPIVPLFETIDDLESAAAIMEKLWQVPQYRIYLDRSEDRSQMVMLGYSDSTKDGGYLAASWMLHQAQQKLVELAQRQNIRLVIFHGRGGALGRGGGPAAQAVRSLPPGSVNCAMRVTEQGEILAERYDDPEIAFRHLEQVTWASLIVSAEKTPQSHPQFEAVMNQMAASSLAEYRRLITHPEFMNYFDSATPVAEIENLPIASRPARRSERRSLSDLRAIPWTFAWTQSRQLVPAWYGVGTALQKFVNDHDGQWKQLQTLYDEWQFFSATIDNTELALAKSDIEIAHCYSALCEQGKAMAVWEMIREEYTRTRAAILMLKRQDELLDRTAWLQRSIRARNPSVDPLNLLQIRMLRESRSDNEEEEDSTGDSTENSAAHILRLTIHGIAAGLRTTG